MSPKEPTLGELLINAGKVTQAQVEEAIQAQVIFGGRLGTNLIELGYLDIKTLSDMLSKKFRVDALENPLSPGPVDSSLVSLVPKKLAKKWQALPLRMIGPRVGILMSDPSDFTALNELGFAVGKPLKPFVAPELVLFALLEKHYGIKRELRYISLSPTDTKAFSHTTEPVGTLAKSEPLKDVKPEERLDVGINAGLSEPSLKEKFGDGGELSSEDDFDDLMSTYQSSKGMLEPPESAPVKTPARKPPARRPQPKPVAGQADWQIQEPGKPAAGPPPPVEGDMPGDTGTMQVDGGAFTGKMPAIEPQAPPEPPIQQPVQPAQSFKPVQPIDSAAPVQPTLPPEPEEEEEILEDLEILPLSLEEATAELKTVQNRDELSQVVLGFAMSYFKRSALLITRQGLALGWDAMGGSLNKETMQSIMIPLNSPSIFKTVYDNSAFYLGAIPKTPLNDRFIKLMGGEVPRSVFLIPILFGGQVVNILYGDNGHGQDAPINISDLLILAPKVPQAFEDIIKRMKAGIKSG